MTFVELRFFCRCFGRTGFLILTFPAYLHLNFYTVLIQTATIYTILNALKKYDHCSNIVDIDECEEKIDDCEGTCVNTVGSFRCRCSKKGYKLSYDGKKCEGLQMLPTSRKWDLRGWYTLGEVTVSKVCLFPEKGSARKGLNLLSLGSEFFSFRMDPFSEWTCAGKQADSHKLCLPC